jgi:hypothetical protein
MSRLSLLGLSLLGLSLLIRRDDKRLTSTAGFLAIWVLPATAAWVLIYVLIFFLTN